MDCRITAGLVMGQVLTLEYQKDWYWSSSGHHTRRTGTDSS